MYRLLCRYKGYSSTTNANEILLPTQSVVLWGSVHPEACTLHSVVEVHWQSLGAVVRQECIAPVAVGLAAVLNCGTVVAGPCFCCRCFCCCCH